MSKLTRELFDKVMVPNYNPSNVIPVKGEGSWVWDQNGRDYVDFAGGIAVSVLGHAHPALVNALYEQSQKVWHLSNVVTNEPALKLANKLTEMTFADRVLFANSGAESNESALKLARRHCYLRHGSDKHEIIAATNSFHGRTLFTVSVGGQPKYTEGFAPTPGGIQHVPFNDIEALEKTISFKTAAVIMEPIQGEGGVIPATKAYLEQVRRLCDKYEALLIFDEVQTGVGRTGYLYAYQKYNIIPDILTSAKALGGGFPIGAVLCKNEVAQSLTPGTHGSTYGGNPLGCAVSLAVLDEVLKPNRLELVRKKGLYMRKKFQALNTQYQMFSALRGSGLLQGVQLNKHWEGRASDIVEAALEQGLMMLVAGPNVLRFAPSLIISKAEIDEGMKRLGQALNALKKSEVH